MEEHIIEMSLITFMVATVVYVLMCDTASETNSTVNWWQINVIFCIQISTLYSHFFIVSVTVSLLVGRRIELHLAVFRSYFWFCAQESLLEILGAHV